MKVVSCFIQIKSLLVGGGVCIRMVSETKLVSFVSITMVICHKSMKLFSWPKFRYAEVKFSGETGDLEGPGGGGVAGAPYIQDFRGNDIEISDEHQRRTYQLSCCR